MSHYFLLLNAVPPRELETARGIEDAIRDACYSTGEELPVDRRNCPNPTEFFSALENVKKRIQNRGEVPTVHLDGHGDRENLRFPDGEKVSWTKVLSAFREINVLSCNNIFLTSGACESAYAMKGSEILMPAPVFALLAPAKVVPAGVVRDGFATFYRALIQTADAGEAIGQFVRENPRTFSVLFCERLFELSAANYIVKHCEGKGRRKRQEALTTRALEERPDLSIKYVRRNLKNLLRQDPFLAIERMYREFLIVDECPENRERFPFRVDRIEKRVEEIRNKLELQRDGSPKTG